MIITKQKTEIIQDLTKTIGRGAVQLDKNVGTELSNFRERMTGDNESIFNIIR